MGIGRRKTGKSPRFTRTLSIALALLLLAVAPVLSLTFGPDLTFECSGCRARLFLGTLLSGNTLDGRTWTDGYTYYPMMPSRPALVKCPKCRTMVWVDDAVRVKMDPQSDERHPLDAVAPLIPGEADYLAIASGGGLPRKREAHVRRMAWWAANEPVRWAVSEGGPEEEEIDRLYAQSGMVAPVKVRAKPPFSPAAEESLRAFAALLDPQEPGERLLKAEILRELGQFPECVELLSASFGDQRLGSVAERIRRYASKGISRVQRLH